MKKSIKQQRKAAAKAEVLRRCKIVSNRGYIYNGNDWALRLLCFLMKSWKTSEGKVWTLHKYLAKYDKAELYRHVKAVRHNLTHRGTMGRDALNMGIELSHLKMNHYYHRVIS